MSNTDYIVMKTARNESGMIVYCTNSLEDAQRFCKQCEAKHCELTIYKAKETYQN